MCGIHSTWTLFFSATLTLDPSAAQFCNINQTLSNIRETENTVKLDPNDGAQSMPRPPTPPTTPPPDPGHPKPPFSLLISPCCFYRALPACCGGCLGLSKRPSAPRGGPLCLAYACLMLLNMYTQSARHKQAAGTYKRS